MWEALTTVPDSKGSMNVSCCYEEDYILPRALDFGIDSHASVRNGIIYFEVETC